MNKNTQQGSYTLHHSARGKWWKISLGFILILLLVAAVAGGTVYFIERQQLLTPEKRLQLRNAALVDPSEDEDMGSARREYANGAWRIFVRIKLDPPPSGKSYHGWYKSKDTGEIRYAGEFFAAGEREYSLTYTTQEDVARFATFQVSVEDAGLSPERPSNNLIEWEFVD